MADLYRRGEDSQVFSWTPGVEQPVRLLGQGVDDHQRDLGRPHRRESASCRSRTISGCGRSRRAARQARARHSRRASTRSGSSRGTGSRPQKFLADLCIDYRGGDDRLAAVQLPELPRRLPAAGDLQGRGSRHEPAAAGSTRSSPRSRRGTPTTSATPGTTNAAVNETLNRFLIPRMFAARLAGQDDSAADSVRATAREMRQIWAKWRAAGKV